MSTSLNTLHKAYHTQARCKVLKYGRQGPPGDEVRRLKKAGKHCTPRGKAYKKLVQVEVRHG